MSPARPEFSLVVPCYNEQESIPFTIPPLCTAFEKAGITFELMLVNRSLNDAVLMLDVTPAGTLSVPLPAATITDTTPIALTPTSTAVVSGTPTLEPTGTVVRVYCGGVLETVAEKRDVWMYTRREIPEPDRKSVV